jgi:hypothetical protein
LIQFRETTSIHSALKISEFVVDIMPSELS